MMIEVILVVVISVGLPLLVAWAIALDLDEELKLLGILDEDYTQTRQEQKR